MSDETREAIAKALRSAGRPANLLTYMREVGASDVTLTVVAAYLSHCADLVMLPDGGQTEHRYVPSSRWSGDHRFPRWAACACGWHGPAHVSWELAEQDFAEHIAALPVSEVSA